MDVRSRGKGWSDIHSSWIPGAFGQPQGYNGVWICRIPYLLRWISVIHVWKVRQQWQQARYPWSPHSGRTPCPLLWLLINLSNGWHRWGEASPPLLGASVCFSLLVSSLTLYFPESTPTPTSVLPESHFMRGSFLAQLPHKTVEKTVVPKGYPLSCAYLVQ